MSSHNVHSTTRVNEPTTGAVGNPISPKAPAAAVGAVVATTLATLLLDEVGVDIDADALGVVLTDVIVGLAAFAAAYAKNDPRRAVTRKR